MEKNERKKININSNKRLVSALTLIVALITLTLCLVSTIGRPQPAQSNTNFNPLNPHPLAITWDVRMNFSETGGKTDYVYFGEAPDANDGPPADSYDVVKPPAPMPPYIRAWFNDNLPAPYDVLWKDYRHYPGIHKVWNLTVHWMPSSAVPTTVTISWSTSKINNSEYDTVVLSNATGIRVPNMRTTGSFTFTCPPYVPQDFKINCSVDTKPPQIINHSPATGETGDSYTFNASVFDDMTPKSSLIVKVNWVHGSLSGNDTMTSVGGNYFVKTITLSNYTTVPLTYHFYAKDAAKVPNVNYTTQLSATITDDEPPQVIDTTTGTPTTGDSFTFSATATDNIGVSTVYVEYWYGTWTHTNISMTAGGGNTYTKQITVLSNTTQTLYYIISAKDAKPNWANTGTKNVGNVVDNDAPGITSVAASPPLQIVNGYVNITATITDNINLLEKKVRITGPAGYTPVNISMTKDGGNNYYYNNTYPIAGIYNYSIWAKDTSNNGATSTIYQFNIYAKLQITTLLSSWNFVSLPFNQSVSKIQLIVKYGGTEYYWSKAVANGYVLTFIYDWNRTSQQYVAVDGLAPGRGYWIYAYNGCELWATNLTSMVTNNYITALKYKWNIVGVPIGSSVSKTALIINYGGVDYTWNQSVTNGYVLNYIFGWTRTLPQGYFIANALDPGYCYWIYAYQDCILKRVL